MLAEEAERNKPSPLDKLRAELEDRKPVPCLVQWVTVRVIDGKTITKLHPSNEELLENSKTMDPPPEKVYRNLFFDKPEEIDGYDWVDDELPGLSNCRDQKMSFPQWLRTIASEKHIDSGHIGPAEPDDDPPSLAEYEIFDDDDADAEDG